MFIAFYTVTQDSMRSTSNIWREGKVKPLCEWLTKVPLCTRLLLKPGCAGLQSQHMWEAEKGELEAQSGIE